MNEENLSEAVIKDIPAAYIIILVVNGFLIFVLTPLRILLSPWINPFAQDNPTDALSSIAILLLCSSIIGFPGFLGRNFITGNNGLNARLNYRKFKKRLLEEKGREKTDRVQIIQENLKISIQYSKEKAVDWVIRFYAVRSAVLEGIILGAELAFLINIPFVVNSLIVSRFASAILLTVIPFAFGLPAYFYDKYVFKKDFRDLQNAIGNLFKSSN